MKHLISILLFCGLSLSSYEGFTRDSTIVFTEEEEEFINDCVNRLDSLIAYNEALSLKNTNEVFQFAVDWRDAGEKSAFKVSNISAINAVLNAIYNQSTAQGVKVCPYVLFTNSIGDGKRTQQLLDELNSYFESDITRREEQRKRWMEQQKPSNESTQSAADYGRTDRHTREVTNEIISRSALSKKGYAGILIHNYSYIEKNGTGYQRYISLQMALDKTAPLITLADIESKARNTAKSVGEWNAIFYNEALTLQTKLKSATQPTAYEVYIKEATDLLNSSVQLNAAKLNNFAFNPYLIDESQINCNKSGFREEGLNYLISKKREETYGATRIHISETSRKDINRRLAFLEYETKKPFYVLTQTLEFQDVKAFNVQSFAKDIYTRSSLSNRDGALVVVLKVPTLVGGGISYQYKYSIHAKCISQGMVSNMLASLTDGSWSGKNLWSQEIEAMLREFSFFEQVLLQGYADVPKPLIEYNVFLNNNCDMARTVNIARNISGKFETRILRCYSQINQIGEWHEHKLLAQYIDEFHMNEALSAFLGVAKCTDGKGVDFVWGIMNQRPPDFARGIEIDYFQLAIDLASVVSIFLPTPYGVAVAGVGLVYYLTKANYTGAALEMLGILASSITRTNVMRFFNGEKWSRILSESSSLSSVWLNRASNLAHPSVYNFSGFAFKTNDEFIDIIIHSNNGKYMVAKGGDMFMEYPIEGLARLIDEAPSNKTVRLLSCNNLEAARNLSAQVKRPFYASDGWVDVYKNGEIRSANDFYLFEAGQQNLNSKLAKNSSEITGVSKVRLGVNGPGNLTFNSLIKNNLNKLGVSDDVTNYLLVPNSKGGAYILHGVTIEAKEIALADEIWGLTGKRCVFPKNKLQGIEGFLEDGTAFTMKELESNFNNFYTRINQMAERIKADPDFQWISAEGYLKIPFGSFTKWDGTLQVVTKQYVEQLFNAGIGKNAFTIKNDGTVNNITIFLQDGSRFKLDLTKLKP